MTGAEKREIIDNYAESTEIPLLCIDGHDDAIIGLAAQFNTEAVAYDRELIIQGLVKDGMSREDAEEYFGFNIIGAYVGEHTPIILTTMDGIFT